MYFIEKKLTLLHVINTELTMDYYLMTADNTVRVIFITKFSTHFINRVLRNI